MMIAFDSFARLFDNGGSRTVNDSWKVLEKDEQAQLKCLTIENPNSMFKTIENGAYKNMYNMSKGLSTWIEDDDCDGIACTEKDGKKFILITELKSNVQSEKIFHAFQQIVYSYLKLNMLLSVCEGYDVDKYEFIGIIACAQKGNNSLLKFKSNLFLKQNANKASRKENLVYKIVEYGINTEFGKIHLMQNHQLKENLLRKNIKVIFKTTEPNGDSINVSMNDLV